MTSQNEGIKSMKSRTQETGDYSKCVHVRTRREERSRKIDHKLRTYWMGGSLYVRHFFEWTILSTKNVLNSCFYK